MEIDPADVSPSWTYRTLTSVVVPRPIGWIATRSESGEANLAPYSFFNGVSTDPPVVVFAALDRPHGLTDSAQNIVDTGEFVHNLVTMELAEEMNATSATLDRGDDEFAHAGLTADPATVVDVPMVAEAMVNFECTLHDTVEVGNGLAIFGEVVKMHVDDALLTEAEKVDVDEVDALGRLSGGLYCDTRNRLHMERPP
ncbi:MAG: flavin reductase family protein [Haloarculaceae archaeon]